MANQNSWIDLPKDSDFSLQNIPFGVFSKAGLPARCCTAIGPYVADLAMLASHDYFKAVGIPAEVFYQHTLNDFIALGKEKTNAVRERLINLFSSDNLELQDHKELHSSIFHRHADVSMGMPVNVSDYTDFYSSKEHATNVGAMFRDPENALLPNWKHLPVAYHGRASSIVVSGTPLIRPKGQFKTKEDTVPKFGPTQSLDFELEMGFVIGKSAALGESIPIARAEEYIFGFLLFNDWSARDIQSWEYVPLGPFLGKNFMSSISPWIITLEALAPFRMSGPQQDVAVLPYLKFDGDKNYDIQLEIDIQPDGGTPECIGRSNFSYMYWNVCQQLAHHTVNGCNVVVGDIMASGTISGPSRDSAGCLLELTRNGKEPFTLMDGTTRKFLLDGDTVIMKGHASKGHLRVGFGEVSGKIKPAV